MYHSQFSGYYLLLKQFISVISHKKTPNPVSTVLRVFSGAGGRTRTDTSRGHGILSSISQKEPLGTEWND
jgi:hypothetical protein